MRFCLCMGGGETTPLVCCLWCVMCHVYVWWVVCVHCFGLLLFSYCRSVRACARRWPVACPGASVAARHMATCQVSVWWWWWWWTLPLFLLARCRPPGTGTRQGQESTPTQPTARVPPHLPQHGRVAARDATGFSSPSPSLITNTAPPDGPQSRKQTLQQTQTRGASCAIGGARVDLAAVATAFPGQPEVKSCCCCPPPPP